MNEALIRRAAEELSLAPKQALGAARLLEEGASVPFIARYRKEATGGMDEVAAAALRDRLEELTELEKRREAILASLSERGLLDEPLRAAILGAPDKNVLEDLYLPHRVKRRTRAAIARERGLEPLAAALFAQRGVDPVKAAAAFVNPAKEIPDADAALAGARDVIAEQASESPRIRAALRGLFARRCRLVSRPARGKREETSAYRDWFDWEEPLRAAAGHRLLAMFRGEREGALSVSLRPPEDEALDLIQRLTVKGRGSDSAQVALAVADGYKRLLAPSLENEIRTEAKSRAESEAIGVFAANLRRLLLAPPLGRKRLLALDPGYRTGAKVAVLDAQGALVAHLTVYPTGSSRQREEAAAVLRELTAKHAPQAVAVGNGTAGRETETFVKSLNLGLPVIVVNEAGASVYSASETARREFPDLDLTVRGAVSIGRRLMDPLAELVKIDPKAIGVGQYQHDVDQSALRRSLDDVAVSCVNAVGVDVNVASPELLSKVSGLGPALAANIVAHRLANGPFPDRQALKKVKRLGPAAFEQAAGFLRVRGANPLDASAVHPERYDLVARMAADAGCAVRDLMERPEARARIKPETYLSDEVGEPTLRDLMEELARPGRDPRPAFHAFAFAENVKDVADLKPGMRLPGVVTNVTTFGAFVDVGVHRDGLVHISRLAERYVANPAEVVAPGQEVMVTVIEVDPTRGRVSLSMRREDGEAAETAR